MSLFADLRENREFALEIKFLVPRPVAAEVSAWARARLSPDPYGSGEFNDSYRISSLYFDTDQFDVFLRRGSFGRSKYRIRRYGDGEVVFLERKLKTKGLLAKRRSIVELEAMNSLTYEQAERGWVGYWFHRRLVARKLKPVCQISYLRTARVTMTSSGPIRLTLDEGLCARPAQHLVFDHSAPDAPMLTNEVVLELKFRIAMPSLFKELIEAFKLSPQPVSKYRHAINTLGLVSNATGNTSSDRLLNSMICAAY